MDFNAFNRCHYNRFAFAKYKMSSRILHSIVIEVAVSDSPLTLSI